MDNFREWVSDNLRYILLGLAVIVLAVALFFGIRFLTSAVGDKDADAGKNTEQNSDAGEDTETTTPTPRGHSSLKAIRM